MSEAIHFDTHKFVKRMTETGMSEATAEALTDEQLRLIQGELATKTDLAALQAATKADIEALRLATQADIAGVRLEIEKTKADLIRWMAGLLIAQGGVIIAMLRVFPA